MEGERDQFSDLDVISRLGRTKNPKESSSHREVSLEDDNVLSVPAEPMMTKAKVRIPDPTTEFLRNAEETQARSRNHLPVSTDADLQRTLQAVVDTSVKYYTDKILQVLEGYNQRIQTVERVLERVQCDVNTIKTTLEDQCETYEGRFNSIDSAAKENLRLTQLMRDKQEIREAQEELKKLAKKPPKPTASDEASESCDEDQGELQSPKKEKGKVGTRRPPLEAMPTDSEGTESEPMRHQPVAPPYFVPPATAAAPQFHYNDRAPPSSNQHGMQLPPRQPYAPEVQDMVAQPGSQQAMYPSQSQHAPDQKHVPGMVMGGASYPSRATPSPQYPQVTPQQGYNLPPQFSKPKAAYMPSEENASSFDAYSAAGPRLPSYPRVYGNPPSSKNDVVASSNPAQVTTSKMPIEKVISDVANMGFSRDQVYAVVRTLHANGQSIDLNVVLDKLMSEGARRTPGWS